jgi:hypothetical protein
MVQPSSDHQGRIKDARSRRHMTAGQRALAVAFAYPEEGKRGRGKKDPGQNSMKRGVFSADRLWEALKVPENGSFKRELLRQARKILAHSRELADGGRGGVSQGEGRTRQKERGEPSREKQRVFGRGKLASF